MTPCATAVVQRVSPGDHTPASSLDFALPDDLLAHEPPEARGLARDGVRLLVTDAGSHSVRHATAHDLPEFLRAGDLLVVNASATFNAALDAWRPDGAGVMDELIAVHLSSPVPHAADEREWIIELRRLTKDGTKPLFDAQAGERIRLRGGGSATLLAPFSRPSASVPNVGVRLWRARLDLPGSVLAYADEHGSPIRYGYVPRRWPLTDYQTVFATEPGSAEMPSAGRPFTRELVARLEGLGVAIASIVLHTGVASLESGEAPYPERYRVSANTADAVNRTHDRGGRVIAVGTTVVRALETVAAADGIVRAGDGWTDVVVNSERGVRAVDGLLTGLHEPRASHLTMLEAIAGRAHLAIAYRAALDAGYRWHEFGDVHLIIGNRESGIGNRESRLMADG
jgi:S-adenosylmethionine:tRNA ribosyltransferase-isomerase